MHPPRSSSRLTGAFRPLMGAVLAAVCCEMAWASTHPPPAPVQADSSSVQRAARRDLAHIHDLLGRGATDQAIAALRERVRQEPDDGDAHLLLGRALALLPEPGAALAALGRAIELEPASWEAHASLGMALARFGDAAAARVAFERAVALDPRASDVRIHLALTLAQAGEHETARQHLTAALELLGNTPGAAYAHYLLAQSHRESGDMELALRHLAAAVERRPDYAEAWLAQGLIKSHLRDDAGALQALQAAVRFAPEDDESRARLGAAYLRSGQPAEAIPHLQRVLQANPADRTTVYHLCRALLLAGRRAEADRCAEELPDRFASDSSEGELDAAAANNEGIALEAVGDVAAALERYRAAVALWPSNTVFRRNLALALCRLGRWQEGIRELQTVLEADPNDADATRALYIAMERVRSGTSEPR